MDGLPGPIAPEFRQAHSQQHLTGCDEFYFAGGNVRFLMFLHLKEARWERRRDEGQTAVMVKPAHFDSRFEQKPE